MKKIISLFKRDYEKTRMIYDEIVPGAEWVVAGEGWPTIKIDGTSCMVESGLLYKRYDAKNGKAPPEGFIPAQDPDPVTGHWPGWLRVNENKPEDKWHNEAWNKCGVLPDGTYELIGPKIQNNPYSLTEHEFIKHGAWLPLDNDWPPTDFIRLRQWLESRPEYEGIVWHRENGDMVKIKRRDYGLSWPNKLEYLFSPRRTT